MNDEKECCRWRVHRTLRKSADSRYLYSWLLEAFFQLITDRLMSEIILFFTEFKSQICFCWLSGSKAARRLRYLTARKTEVSKICGPWNHTEICCHRRPRRRSSVPLFDEAEQRVPLHGVTFVLPVFCSSDSASRCRHLFNAYTVPHWRRGLICICVCIIITFCARPAGTVNRPLKPSRGSDVVACMINCRNLNYMLRSFSFCACSTPLKPL